MMAPLFAAVPEREAEALVFLPRNQRARLGGAMLPGMRLGVIWPGIGYSQSGGAAATARLLAEGIAVMAGAANEETSQPC